MRPTLLRALLLALTLALPACLQAVDGEQLFGHETRHVVVEIVYGPGAQPLTVRSDGSLPFVRTKRNLERAFQGTNKTLEIPTSLDEMRLVPAITGANLSMGDVVDLARAERRRAPSQDTAVIVVAYVPGMLEGTSNLWGNTQSARGMTAIAAGSIRSRFQSEFSREGTNGKDFVSDVEQVVLIHELGHELGLVDAGLPMASPHLDDGDDGHHCSNPHCVMHTQSGMGSMKLPGFDGNDRLVLFGDECLGDIAAVVKATNMTGSGRSPHGD